VDSKSSIAISESLKTGSNVGHMMMRINYIYQEVLAKTVEVKYINTHNQVADILTKPLALEQYAVLSDRLFRDSTAYQLRTSRTSMFRLSQSKDSQSRIRGEYLRFLGF
jgi:hypothetical protein